MIHESGNISSSKSKEFQRTTERKGFNIQDKEVINKDYFRLIASITFLCRTERINSLVLH